MSQTYNVMKKIRIKRIHKFQEDNDRKYNSKMEQYFQELLINDEPQNGEGNDVTQSMSKEQKGISIGMEEVKDAIRNRK